MSAMFKAVVWKELRENLKWAVVVLAGMTAVLAFGTQSLDELMVGAGLGFTGIFNSLDPITSIGGMLAGLLLGAAQTVLENRGDKWGFLAHRPIGRTSLFWGKAAAGTLLYVISTALPVAVVFIWMNLPGYLPFPFDWRMALPAIANLLCGLVFYFAGLLTGMRDARWYGSRVLGIGAAVYCLILQEAVVTEFWQAVAASAVGLLIVGTAAWGTFVTGGRYANQPRIGRIATGLSIGLGLIFVGWIALMILLNSFAQFRVIQQPRYVSYTVTTDGEVVRVTRMQGQIVEITDPDGRPLERYRNLAPRQRLGVDVVTANLSPRLQESPPFRSSRRLLVPISRANVYSSVGWYYAHRLGLIGAYDDRARKQIGWIGPDGFSAGDVKPRPFSGKLIRSSQTSLVFDDAVYRLDLDQMQVAKVFQPEPAEMVLDASVDNAAPNKVATVADFGEATHFQAISTTKRIIVQLRDGTRILETPQDSRALEYPVLLVSRALRAPGMPTFLWYQDNLNSEWGRQNRIDELSSAGTVVKSWKVPASNYAVTEAPGRVILASAMFPLVGRLPTLELPPFDSFRQTGLPYPVRESAERLAWTVAILSALASAVAAFVHGRRYAFRPGRLSTWIGISFFLGPIGYLLMLALMEWPAREACPGCSRKRVVTREHCEHCGEPFARPAEDGTEIFEPIPGALA